MGNSLSGKSDSPPPLIKMIQDHIILIESGQGQRLETAGSLPFPKISSLARMLLVQAELRWVPDIQPQEGAPLPMKGCRLLRRLAEDHHRALAAAQRLRGAIEIPEPLAHATARFMRIWREEIVPHFRKEEEVLLPDLAQQISEGDAVIMLTLTDHIVLRGLVREVERSSDDRRRSLVPELIHRLEEHTRFEEQTLFPAIEQTLGRTRLTELEGELTHRRADFAVGLDRT